MFFTSSFLLSMVRFQLLFTLWFHLSSCASSRLPAIKLGRKLIIKKGGTNPIYTIYLSKLFISLPIQGWTQDLGLSPSGWIFHRLRWIMLVFSLSRMDLKINKKNFRPPLPQFPIEKKMSLVFYINVLIIKKECMKFISEEMFKKYSKVKMLVLNFFKKVNSLCFFLS